jgi:hypothetical protein
MPSQQILDDKPVAPTVSISNIVINYALLQILFLGCLLSISYVGSKWRLEEWIEIFVYVSFFIGSPVLNGVVIWRRVGIKATVAFMSGFFILFGGWFFSTFISPMLLFNLFEASTLVLYPLDLPKILIESPYLLSMQTTTPSILILGAVTGFYVLFCVLLVILTIKIIQSYR